MNCWTEWSTLVANFATIVTALVAVWAWNRFRSDSTVKRERLVEHLRADKGRKLSAINISKETGLTEGEVFQFSVNNPNVKMLAHVDRGTGLADEILFQYNDAGST
jgi:hypothetical protein